MKAFYSVLVFFLIVLLPQTVLAQGPPTPPNTDETTPPNMTMKGGLWTLVGTPTNTSINANDVNASCTLFNRTSGGKSGWAWRFNQATRSWDSVTTLEPGFAYYMRFNGTGDCTARFASASPYVQKPLELSRSTAVYIAGSGRAFKDVAGTCNLRSWKHQATPAAYAPIFERTYVNGVLTWKPRTVNDALEIGKGYLLWADADCTLGTTAQGKGTSCGGQNEPCCSTAITKGGSCAYTKTAQLTCQSNNQCNLTTTSSSTGGTSTPTPTTVDLSGDKNFRVIVTDGGNSPVSGATVTVKGGDSASTCTTAAFTDTTGSNGYALSTEDQNKRFSTEKYYSVTATKDSCTKNVACVKVLSSDDCTTCMDVRVTLQC